jgi:hypothetical protein
MPIGPLQPDDSDSLHVNLPRRSDGGEHARGRLLGVCHRFSTEPANPKSITVEVTCITTMRVFHHGTDTLVLRCATENGIKSRGEMHP